MEDEELKDIKKSLKTAKKKLEEPENATLKKIGLAIPIVIIVVLIVLLMIWLDKSGRATDAAIAKAEEEFVQDYGNQEHIIKCEMLDDKYVITIYGEEDMAVYLYNNGEIYNYMNRSN